MGLWGYMELYGTIWDLPIFLMQEQDTTPMWEWAKKKPSKSVNDDNNDHFKCGQDNR